MSQQPVQAAQVASDFSLNKSIQSLCNQWTECKQTITSSDAYKTYQQSKQKIGTQVCTPLTKVWRQTYQQLPIETTKLKFNYLQDYTFKERLVFLNVLAIGGALLSMRRINIYNAWGQSFKAVKISTLTYIFGGLLFAPEIYNPLMNSE